MIRLLVISSVLLAAGACSSDSSSPAPSSTDTAPTAPPVAPTVAVKACRVTVPGGPPPPTALPPAPFIGNGRLWAGLWPRGLVIVPPGDISRRGSLRMKFMWWRGRGARGLLHISGSEIASGRAIHARTFGYGYTGFNASSIFFPGQGCYRVTGTAGRSELTFVTLVRTCSVLPSLPPARRRSLAGWCAG